MTVFFLVLGIALLALVLTDALRFGITPNPSPSAVYYELEKELPEALSGAIYDVGGGFGGPAYFFAKKYPNCSVTAFEGSLLPYVVLKLRTLFLGKPKNLSIAFGNFHNLSPENPTLIYAYLYPKGMEKLHAWMQKEQFHSLHLISFTFALPHYTPQKKHICTDLYHSPLYFYWID